MRDQQKSTSNKLPADLIFIQIYATKMLSNAKNLLALLVCIEKWTSIDQFWDLRFTDSLPKLMKLNMPCC